MYKRECERCFSVINSSTGQGFVFNGEELCVSCYIRSKIQRRCLAPDEYKPKQHLEIKKKKAKKTKVDIAKPMIRQVRFED